MDLERASQKSNLTQLIVLPGAYGFVFIPLFLFVYINMSQKTSSDDGVPGPSFRSSDGPSSGSLSHLSGGVSTHFGTTLSLQALIGPRRLTNA